jgi:CubicO group peptidase (beta-lactamase class C family)
MIHLQHVAIACMAFIGAESYLLPTFPQPVDLTSDSSVVAERWRNLTSTFARLLDSSDDTDADNPLLYAKNLTFSLGMFSLHDAAVVNHQYHHAGPETLNSTIGIGKTPDAESIYQLASVSKLITAYAGMILLSEEDWNRPITEYMPKLQEYAQQESFGSGPAFVTAWDEINLLALTSQQSGIATNPFPAGDTYFTNVLQSPNPESAATYQSALPQLTDELVKLGPCAVRALANASDLYCSAEDNLIAMGAIPPNFVPWTTPAYSDGAFMLAGKAISNLTGKSYAEMYHDTIFFPLNMSSSYTLGPRDNATLSRSVVTDGTLAEWLVDTGSTMPSGGIYSSLSDLSKLGVAILNNTLISSETTRRWMKAETLSDSLSFAVGRGWEIHRYVNPSTSKVTDLYTKLGDSGSHGSGLVLIPQYGVGFAIAGACSSASCPGYMRGYGMLAVMDLVTETVIDALEQQAQLEAIANFAGRYVTSTKDGVNASVTIAFNQTDTADLIPALTVTEWIYNDTDALTALGVGSKPAMKPSIEKQTLAGVPGQVAFQLSTFPNPPSYEAATQSAPPAVLGPEWKPFGIWTSFYVENADFALTDQARFAGVGRYLFVFDVDGAGRAIALRPAVQRIRLERVK